MAKLKNMLEPGETVLVTDPPIWLRRTMLAGGVAIAGLMVGLPLIGLARVGDKIDGIMLLVGLLGGAMALYAMTTIGRWRLTITNRRILARKNFFHPTGQEMRREQVEDVSFHPMSLTFQGGRDLLVSTGSTAFMFQRAAVRAAFDPAWDEEPAPESAAPPLDPGEVVLARSRPNIWGYTVNGLMLAALGGVLASLGYEPFHESPLSVLPLVAGFFFMVLFYATQILPHLLYRADSWTVTDSRVIAKRGLWKPEYRQMQLDKIDRAEWSSGEMIFTGGGLSLKIPGAAIPAELLTRLLPRWFPNAGKPMARLGRILQPGETAVFHDTRSFSSWCMRVCFLVAIVTILWGFIGDLAAGEWGKAMVWLLFPVIMLSSFTDVPLGSKGWRIAITDRRLLVCMDRDDSRYEEFPLNELEIENPGGPGEMFTLRHGDRKIPIHTETAKAEKRILEAIARAKGAA